MPELVVGWIVEMGDAENVFVDFEIGHGVIVHPKGRDGKAGAGADPSASFTLLIKLPSDESRSI